MENIYYMAPAPIHHMLEKLSDHYDRPINEIAHEAVCSAYSAPGLQNLEPDNQASGSMSETDNCERPFLDEYSKGVYFELPDYVSEAVKRVSQEQKKGMKHIFTAAFQEYYRKSGL